jgi:branched-chain amino acid transport system substrate-binding protein
MSKTITLTVGEGHFDQGFPVVATISAHNQVIRQITHHLPPAPCLVQEYLSWQRTYYGLALIQRLFPGRVVRPVEEGQATHISFSNQDCQLAAQNLKNELHRWFDLMAFRELREFILDSTSDVEPLRVIFSTKDPYLQRLPWHLWNLFDRRPNAEVIISPPANAAHPSTLSTPLKILAILGCREGIDIGKDEALIDNLKQKGAIVEWLHEPQRHELSNRLWDQKWDVLFFAGHSSSQAESRRGEIRLNAHETLPLNELKFHFVRAVQQGLKLAIFNSCDGLGMAQDLSNVGIPHTIVMREPVPDRVAQEFLDRLLRCWATGTPLYLAMLEARQKLEAMEDEYPCASWLPVLCQNLGANELIWSPSPVREAAVPLARTLFFKRSLAALGAIAIAALGFYIIPQLTPKSLADDSGFSFGEEPLFATSNFAKQAGIVAFKAKDYSAAVRNFQNAFDETRDPETLIYLNNAKIGDAKSYTLAVTVPIGGSNPNNATEMLRGFAQAQDQVNRQGGIAGTPLRLLIVNDNDNENDARKNANELVKDKQVLAVAGHWTSDVSLAAAPIYNNNELVFITAMSTTRKLSGFGSYVFRANINSKTGAQALAEQMLKGWKLRKAAIFYIKDEAYSESLRSEFKEAIQLGGEVVDEFDFSNPTYNTAQSLSQAVRDGAEVVFLATSNRFFDSAIEVIQINKNTSKLKVLGDLANLYNSRTLAQSGNAAEGMVMAVSWNIESTSNPDFRIQSEKLWGGSVNHVTANSYDAAAALIQALSQAVSKGSNLREQIKAELRDPHFAAVGAGGTLKFDAAGDRQTKAQLVEVQARKNSRSGTDYDFVPIPTP